MPLAEAYDYASQVMTENMLDARSQRRHLRLPGKAGAEVAGLTLPQYPDTLIKSILRSGQDHRHGGRQRQ